jgi:hypothetical protein
LTDSEDQTNSLTLLIECSNDGLTADVSAEFGEDNISASSNFIGGASIAVFLVASIRTLRPTIQSILNFLAQRDGRYDDARIVYDGKKIELKGYSPDDVEKILDNSAFDKLRP